MVSEFDVVDVGQADQSIRRFSLALLAKSSRDSLLDLIAVWRAPCHAERSNCESYRGLRRGVLGGKKALVCRQIPRTRLLRPSGIGWENATCNVLLMSVGTAVVNLRVLNAGNIWQKNPNQTLHFAVAAGSTQETEPRTPNFPLFSHACMSRESCCWCYRLTGRPAASPLFCSRAVNRSVYKPITVRR
jgi:hypothetical protein